MLKFKLDLSKKTPLQKISLGTTHITAMNNNSAFPVTNRLPADAAFAAAHQDLITAEADVNTKKNAWKQAIITRDNKETAFDGALTSRASYCEAAQPENLEALTSTALPLRPAPEAVGDLTAPGDFRASMGDHAGELDLMWDPVYGAVSYNIEYMEHGVAGAIWLPLDTISQSRHTVTGLTSGKNYAFRVRAVGPEDDSPWSDEAVKMAP